MEEVCMTEVGGVTATAATHPAPRHRGQYRAHLSSWCQSSPGQQPVQSPHHQPWWPGDNRDMSIKCLLPPVTLCGQRRRRRRDDRPFPEDDHNVFPRENLYDRIVLPGKLYHFGHFANHTEGTFVYLIYDVGPTRIKIYFSPNGSISTVSYVELSRYLGFYM